MHTIQNKIIDQLEQVKQEKEILDGKIDSKTLVVQSNDLIERSYRLTLREKKIILILASQITKEDTNFNIMRFKVTDIERMLDIQGKGFYGDLAEITKGLTQKGFEIRTLDNLGRNRIIQVSWLASADYFEHRGVVELEFSEKMKPYLLQLNKCFTPYQLGYVLNCQSVYSIRIYELLKQYSQGNINVREFDLNHFKEKLFLQDKYKQFSHLRTRVIEVAQKELKQKTDIYFEYETKTIRKKVIGITFYIYKNIPEEPPIIDQQEKSGDQLSLFEDYDKEQKRKESEIVKELITKGFKKKDAVEITKGKDVKYLKNKIQAAYDYAAKNKVENLPGLIRNFLERDWKTSVEIQHETWENEKKAQKQVQKKLKQKQKDQVEKQKRIDYDSYLHQQAKKYLDELSPDEIKPMEKIFLDYLKNEKKTFIFNRCRKKGAINCPNDFLPWIVEKYLEGKIMSFENFKN